ncbi:P-loop NTPase fold protein [Alteribacter natronophilus]|uniref:P-loop NTPase fold protein n=1 Tax=Alteribacter natronophilus TaxID=2583810 RepID=UPI00110DBBFB|nr:P-loop NTPase fold protein [Alteribacter natronophilus]TMW71180.1 hypothetical protein FGB90_14560 [Alteribacter natronophilus]
MILEDTIMDYLKKDNVNFALLIKGEWGSGKTHFWNKVLKKKIAYELGEDRINYVSLYGISNIESLKRDVYGKYISLKGFSEQRIKRKEAGIAAVKSLAQGVTNYYGVSSNEIEFDYEKLINIDETIFCIDDFERTQLPTTEVMGFLNNLVEHSGVKMIILANENEIEDEDYPKVKEKLIGKTLTFNLNENEVIPEILEISISNKLLLNDLKRNTQSIIKAFGNSNTNNLRALIQALGDIESIYETVGEEKISEVNKDYKDSLILFTIILSLQIKTNRVSSKIFNSINSLGDFESRRVKEDAKRRINESKGKAVKLEGLLDFSKNYLEGYNMQRKFYNSSKLLVCNGNLDKEKITQELNELITLQNTPPSYVSQILNMYTIPDDEIVQVTNKALAEIKQGTPLLSNYSPCFYMINELIESNVVTLHIDEVFSIFEEGIQKNTYINEYKGRVLYSLVNIEKNVVKQVNTKIMEFVDEKEHENILAEKKDFMTNAFNNDTRDFFLQEFHRRSEELSKHTIKPSEFLEKGLLNFENEELNSFDMSLRVRFKETNLSPQTKDWIIELKNEIECYLVKQSESVLSHLILKRIIDTLNALIEFKEEPEVEE